MSRWHSDGCQQPIVRVGEDGIPGCGSCHATAHELLTILRNQKGGELPDVPPNELPGNLGLRWPPGFPYKRFGRQPGPGVAYSSPEPPEVSIESIENSGLSLPLHNKATTTVTSAGVGGIRDPTYGPTLGPDHFRLICLSHNESPEESGMQAHHISLEIFSHSQCPEYETVSYTWGGEDGDSSPCEPVYVNEYWDLLMQTKNCAAMLRWLHPWRGVRMAWVDAICINQKNTEERGIQVATMKTIYSKCTRVVVWLGKDLVTSTSALHPRRFAFHTLQKNESEDGDGSLLEDQRPLTQAATLQHILSYRYFSRVWVIQELLLAPRAIFPIRDSVFEADVTTSSRLRLVESQALPYTRALWIKSLCQSAIPGKTLVERMLNTSASQAGDLRDRLFGVLGLFPPEEQQALTPDYSLSSQHVFLGLFAYFIFEQRYPQVLFRAVGILKPEATPSWLPEYIDPTAWRSVFEPMPAAKHAVWCEEVSRALDNPGCFKVHRFTTGRYFKSSLHEQDRKIDIPNSDMPYDSPDSSDSSDSDVAKPAKPWVANGGIDMDTGALLTNLTRVLAITSTTSRHNASNSNLYVSRYLTRHADRTDPSYICMWSLRPLDQLVCPGDEIFCLKPEGEDPRLIYFVLRPVPLAERTYTIVAACYEVYFVDAAPRHPLFRGGEHKVFHQIPIFDLNSMADTLPQFKLDMESAVEEAGQLLFAQKDSLTYWDLLPLALSHIPGTKSLEASFEKLYLRLLNKAVNCEFNDTHLFLKFSKYTWRDWVQGLWETGHTTWYDRSTGNPKWESCNKAVWRFVDPNDRGVDFETFRSISAYSKTSISYSPTVTFRCESTEIISFIRNIISREVFSPSCILRFDTQRNHDYSAGTPDQRGIEAKGIPVEGGIITKCDGSTFQVRIV